MEVKDSIKRAAYQFEKLAASKETPSSSNSDASIRVPRKKNESIKRVNHS